MASVTSRKDLTEAVSSLNDVRQREEQQERRHVIVVHRDARSG
jgi:hypothetical protein